MDVKRTIPPKTTFKAENVTKNINKYILTAIWYISGIGVLLGIMVCLLEGWEIHLVNLFIKGSKYEDYIWIFSLALCIVCTGIAVLTHRYLKKYPDKKPNSKNSPQDKDIV